MRFNLSIAFEHKSFGNKLPANYQYELSGWIYNLVFIICSTEFNRCLSNLIAQKYSECNYDNIK